MFAEGESELRDLVVQNLKSCGFLNKIKAELRSGVFLALSEEGSLKKKVPLFNKKLDDYMNTSDGQIALAVVREFLEYFNLNFTLSVFDPEVSNSSPYANRKSLCEDLNINESDFVGPVLSAFLKKQTTINLSDLNQGDYKEDHQDLSIKDFAHDFCKDKGNTFLKNAEQAKKFSDEQSETDKSNKVDYDSSFSLNKTVSGRNFFNFSKPEEKIIFKDQSIDHFFDDPVPSEKLSFLQLGSNSALNDRKKNSPSLSTSEKGSTNVFSESSSIFLKPDKESSTCEVNDQKKLSSIYLQSDKESVIALSDQKKPSSMFLHSDKESTSTSSDQKRPSAFLSSEKRSLSSLKDLPSLTMQDKSRNKELQPLTLGSDILAGTTGYKDNLQEDNAKKDLDPQSNEEYSDRQINSEESIEEEIEEEFSAGLDDLLNSSLSLGEDATSDQTISQTSAVEGVDHLESCNSVN